MWPHLSHDAAFLKKKETSFRLKHKHEIGKIKGLAR